MGNMDSYRDGNTENGCSKDKKVELKLKYTSEVRYELPIQSFGVETL